MAKPAMVTRTIESTEVTVLGLDLELGEPMQKDITLPGTYKDDAKLLKAAQAALDTATYKTVSVVRSEVKENVYGMTETDFIEKAIILDPKTRKPLGEETTEQPAPIEETTEQPAPTEETTEQPKKGKK